MRTLVRFDHAVNPATRENDTGRLHSHAEQDRRNVTITPPTSRLGGQAVENDRLEPQLTAKSFGFASVQSMSEWVVRESSGLAQDFHSRPFPDGEQLRPEVWIHRVTRPALVLGSTQDESILMTDEARSAGYEISTRRSGGGLVLVSPMTSCWIDILLPATHPYWENDISRAFHWVGELWAEALNELGINDCLVHRGPLLNREQGRVLCFAGLGPGEVTLEGQKIVGLSQRRVRTGARFQGLMVSSWNSAPLTRFLKPATLPEGMDLNQLQVGHPMLTPAIIEAVPDALVSLLKNES